MPGIGRHCQISRTTARLAANTKVLRSTAGGTTLVHHRLKPHQAKISLLHPVNRLEIRNEVAVVLRSSQLTFVLIRALMLMREHVERRQSRNDCHGD